jgi:2-polyprenyl-3-methyl-5-hydroxy-6-metoxy-1,4-benzoquinol methylase
MNIINEPRDVKPNNYFNQSRAEMIKYIPDYAKTILDIGCGEGVFGQDLKKRTNREVWGVEISAPCAETAKERLDRVMVGDIESNHFDLPNNYFDCIVCNDVLEHFKDPWRILRRLKNNLKKNGCMIASIPNVRYYKNIKALLLRKEWEYASAGILDFTHLRFFTQKSILSMFDECGYSIITIEGINPMELSWKLKFANMILGDFLNDMKYPQFACKAKIK